EDPFYTVCVHKERDRACGTYGWAVYNALRSLAPGRVWQSTHIGGHRFAGTGLAFPHGTFYGHLDAEDASAIVQAEGQGQMHLPKVRGRSCYAPHVQAADVALREHLGVTAYAALRMKSASSTGENTWRVVFSTRTGDTHTLDATQTESEYEVIKSTDDEKPVNVPVFNAMVVTE
ncbi:MAG: sucrase ferredoxin, partial [Chloroflexota bacterium]